MIRTMFMITMATCVWCCLRWQPIIFSMKENGLKRLPFFSNMPIFIITISITAVFTRNFQDAILFIPFMTLPIILSLLKTANSVSGTSGVSVFLMLSVGQY